MKLRRVVRRCAALFCAALCLAFTAASAGAEVELDCGIGYDGVVTYLRKLPVSVRLTNHGLDASGTLSVQVNRGDGLYDAYDMPVTVAAGATVNVTIPVLLTTKQSAYRVQWLVDGEAAAEREIKPSGVVHPASVIVGALSDDPQGLSQLSITKTADPLKRGETWQTVALDSQTFPEDVDSLRFFDILAVDGVDAGLLNEAQQNALDQWLQEGGVVLLGGGTQAAAAFPYFARYTGISAGALADSGDVSGALMKLLRMSEAAHGQAVMTVELAGAKGQAVGEPRLADVSRVGGGYVFTAAFSLSDKPFSSWQAKNVLWQRLLLEYAQTRYQDIIAVRNGDSAGYQSGQYPDSSITSLIGVENGSGMALPVVLLGVFVALAGFGGYFILKKLDRREWMWAAVPALAVACSLLMWALSGMLDLQKPIAVSYTIVNVDQEGTAEGYTAVAAATANAGRMTVGAEQGTADMNAFVGYYYADNDIQEAEASRLRYRYTYGRPESLSFPETNAWTPNYLLLRDVPTIGCAVSGQCSWNGENLEFSIRNDGSTAFGEGVVITDYGYVSVPALLPGQTVTAVMAPAKSGKAIRGLEDIKDGMLLAEKERMNYSYYDFIQAYTNSEDSKASPEERNERQIRRYMMNNNTNSSSWNTNSICFHYITFEDALADLRLSINGEAATRTAQRGMVDVELAFNPVSADGTVRFLKGSFPVYAAEAGETGRPVVSSLVSNGRYSYFSLNTDPIFGFDMSASPKGLALTGFDIVPNYAYYSYQVRLFNQETGQWDEFKTYEYDQNTGTGKAGGILPELERYVGGDGMLYAQFQKYGKTDNYAEIGTPVLTMDGRLK